MGRICCRFGRVEPRRRAADLVLGLASDLPIKNCWTIAEHVGAARPGRTVCNTCWARWSGITTGVRSDLRGYVVEHLMIERSTMHLMNSSPVLHQLTPIVGTLRAHPYYSMHFQSDPSGSAKKQLASRYLRR